MRLLADARPILRLAEQPAAQRKRIDHAGVLDRLEFLRGQVHVASVIGNDPVILALLRPRGVRAILRSPSLSPRLFVAVADDSRTGPVLFKKLERSCSPSDTCPT